MTLIQGKETCYWRGTICRPPPTHVLEPIPSFQMSVGKKNLHKHRASDDSLEDKTANERARGTVGGKTPTTRGQGEFEGCAETHSMPRVVLTSA